MKNPYQSLPERAFWRPSVSEVEPTAISDVYRPKFPVDKSMRVVTQGSCFSQHIGRQFVTRGYQWFEAETPFTHFPAQLSRAYNYGVFSFRTGNIYTPRLLLQWLRWACGRDEAPDEAWTNREGSVDPFRPAIEPDGFASDEEMLASRNGMIARMRESLPSIDLFIFTFGLTEAWENKESGVVYPMCPGTAGGTFDPDKHVFRNYTFLECHRDMTEAVEILRSFNPAMKILFTVSPVPLTATATGEHVLTANTRSKSLLRTLAATLSEEHDFVDYFPSFEFIIQPPFKAMFYDGNLRTVTKEGVAFVMSHFFKAHGAADETDGDDAPRRRTVTEAENDDLVCEEVMLEGAAAR
ncbi:GSCFA domain-containing protein [Acuticoccus sp. M5D2P5]|uniref:GSCFA domain-containing protein n=1 Tax=Acuticoccus kalidii TaxID=2910977 RepID=UPI001F3A2F7D|nr:GSCFA domain-containing protein [Acuticoccus kalidii]MCF3936481.1 GSCFA domain-containing protein [Acuticoccus kalidii]